ncbi:DUF2986 domain-containing protein [Thalassomonas actiniarum]|uniref:DUF2986 domain-containing protein n=1 Tax=Thalassomonas actiniarum TaxID=485447 RepID=A0AAE9YRS9_9GAMM|nr:DUF2986 domain-containing protein [Thalassomonas actiniarum]WDE00041.1 DUF2986 domain-containing protein [Thalassomonas actiniarum]
MNRKKKIKETLKKKAKKANAKLHKSNKPRYISKAEREKLALAAGQGEMQTEAATEEGVKQTTQAQAQSE